MKRVCTANLIVRNNEGDILLVRRARTVDEAGLWSLPGGTQEIGESIEETLGEISENFPVKIEERP